jgi:hypothetical protein
MLHTENDAAALYNLFASTQNSTRQMIRERLYQPSQRLYSEEFINSQRLDPSTTANIDYNAGLATPPLSNSAAVTPDSANIGVASIGSSTTDISLLLDGLPQTAFVWTGSQVELVFTFNTPQIINRVTISLPAHQGISLVEFTSTPDGVLKEDLAADLPPENLSIDGSAGKYSGDWIADFDPRSVQQLRIVLADFVGNPSMTIRDVSFYQRTFSNSGMAQSLKITAPAGTVLFTADQHYAANLTSISHQMSTDGVHYTGIVPGQQVDVGTGGFWYRAAMQRLDGNFGQAAGPLTMPGQDPNINSGSPRRSFRPQEACNSRMHSGLYQVHTYPVSVFSRYALSKSRSLRDRQHCIGLHHCHAVIWRQNAAYPGVFLESARRVPGGTDAAFRCHFRRPSQITLLDSLSSTGMHYCLPAIWRWVAGCRGSFPWSS